MKPKPNWLTNMKYLYAMKYGIKFLFIFLSFYFFPLSCIYCASQSDAYYHYTLGNMAEMKGEISKAIEEYKKSVSYDTKSVFLRKKLIYLYLLAGNVKEASKEIEELSKLNPEDKEIVELLAEISIYQKKPEDAISSYEKIISTEPSNKKALYNLGILHSQTGKPEKAISYFEKYLELEPESAEIYVSIGILYQRINQLKKAEDYLKKVYEMDPNSVSALIALANLYENKREYNNAIELYEKLLEIFPDDSDLYMKIAGLYLMQKNIPKAKEYLLETEKMFPKNPWINYYLGLIMVEEKKYNDAINYFNKSAKLDKKIAEPHMQKGYVYTMQNNVKKAIESFEKAVSLKTEIADVYFFLALNYEVLNKYKKSEKYLKEAIKLEPDNPKYHFELGIVYDNLKKAEQSEESFFKVIKIDSTTAQAYNYLGYTWADKNIKLDEAEKFVKIALSIDPENPAYIDSLGWIYYRKQKYNEAIELLKKASEKINDSIIFEHLGDCYLSLGNNQMAVDSWETAYLIEKNKKIKNKIEKYKKNIVWSTDIVKLRAIRSFKGILDISGFLNSNTAYNGETFAINGPFFFKKPKQLRIELLGLFSAPQGLILLRQGTIVYITPDNIKYDLSKEFYWVKDIFNIYESEYFDDLIFITENKNSYIFSNNRIEIKIGKKTHLISEIKFFNGSIVAFSDYIQLNKLLFPQKMDFSNPAIKMKTTLILKKLNLNMNIKTDLFNIPEY
ncbi:MAG TPA: hypothetical protein DCP53_09470 [Elusimicrobia bacterium]|nr:MAG: hypothetical protein A2551_04485 [Elusimicrobia bacterium RIFOXYD2_FULL_34_30]HAM39603.1 hypothetical protein [Elusimicrobiota bacterium]